VGSKLHRLGVQLTLAAIVVGLTVYASGAFASAAANPPALMTYITGLPTSPSVWVADAADGSSPLPLGPASSAQISPSGGEVAAVNVEKPTNAWTLSLYPTVVGTPSSTLIPQRPQPMNLLAWSPDSRLILVTVGTSPAQLMIVDTTTSQSRAIATGVIYGASFAPGPSDSVVYARALLNKTAVNIYTTTAAGTDTHQLTNDGHSEDPLWGPGGIVYSRATARAKNPNPELQLWEMNADGSGARPLTSVGVQRQLEGLIAVAFSRNGQHLLANLVGPTGSNAAEPYAVDLSGPKATWRDLTGQGSGYIGDAISANGKTILVTKGTAKDLKALSVVTFPWSGGKPTTIVKQGGYASWNRSQ
jgi:hypothetical protein